MSHAATNRHPCQVRPARWLIAILAGCLFALLSWFFLVLLIDTVWGTQQLRYTLEFGSQRKLVMHGLDMSMAGSWIAFPLIAVTGVLTTLAGGTVLVRTLLAISAASSILFLSLLWLHFTVPQTLSFSLAFAVGLLCIGLVIAGGCRD